MKRYLLTLMLAAAGASIACAEYSAAYYAAMDGKKREALKAAAKTCIQKHTRLVYTDLPTYWQYSDVYPELVNGSKRWWEMYSNETYLIRPNQTAKSSFSANHMQREHSVPKSWWKVGNDVEYTPAYTDMWNLYPSDGAANMAKSNYPLGIVDKASYDNGCTKVGIPVFGYGGGAGNVFEPADEYKGDFARGFFYMATVYDDLQWANHYSYMFTRNEYPTLTKWAYDMMLQWARQDPVSQKEIIRNDAVEKSQGNRNPFVDFPELAEYIWGTRTQETFRIADQGGNVTPPITGDPELTLPVNNETLDFGDVAVGGSQTLWLVLKGKNFTSPLSVRVGGADKDNFIIPERTISASSINSTGEYMLPVQYVPTSIGEHSAPLSIYDGGLEGSIRVNLKGRGCEVPTLTRLQAMSPTDVTEHSYTACWTAAPQTVDYYILYRTRYYSDGRETDELQSDTNSLLIADRDPAVAESYCVVSSRLGFLSELSNTIMVEASGVDEISGDAGYAEVGRLDDGFCILTPATVSRIEVYDISGRLVLEATDVDHGRKFQLPPGAYVITSTALKTPARIIL